MKDREQAVRRSITRTLKTNQTAQRRRACLGHMKGDVTYSKERWAMRHNLRLILASLRFYCARFWLSMQESIVALFAAPVEHQTACG